MPGVTHPLVACGLPCWWMRAAACCSVSSRASTVALSSSSFASSVAFSASACRFSVNAGRADISPAAWNFLELHGRSGLQDSLWAPRKTHLGTTLGSGPHSCHQRWAGGPEPVWERSNPVRAHSSLRGEVNPVSGNHIPNPARRRGSAGVCTSGRRLGWARGGW